LDLSVDNPKQFVELISVLGISDSKGLVDSFAENLIIWLVEALFYRLLDNFCIPVYYFGPLCILLIFFLVCPVGKVVCTCSSSFFSTPPWLAAAETKG